MNSKFSHFGDKWVPLVTLLGESIIKLWKRNFWLCLHVHITRGVLLVAVFPPFFITPFSTVLLRHRSVFSKSNHLQINTKWNWISLVLNRPTLKQISELRTYFTPWSESEKSQVLENYWRHEIPLENGLLATVNWLLRTSLWEESFFPLPWKWQVCNTTFLLIFLSF